MCVAIYILPLILLQIYFTDIVTNSVNNIITSFKFQICSMETSEESLKNVNQPKCAFYMKLRQTEGSDENKS